VKSMKPGMPKTPRQTKVGIDMGLGKHGKSKVGSKLGGAMGKIKPKPKY